MSILLGLGREVTGVGFQSGTGMGIDIEITGNEDGNGNYLLGGNGSSLY